MVTCLPVSGTEKTAESISRLSAVVVFFLLFPLQDVNPIVTAKSEITSVRTMFFDIELKYVLNY
jgi:hypothetical protein